MSTLEERDAASIASLRTGATVALVPKHLERYKRVFEEHNAIVRSIRIHGFDPDADFNDLCQYARGAFCTGCGWGTLRKKCWCRACDPSLHFQLTDQLQSARIWTNEGRRQRKLQRRLAMNALVNTMARTASCVKCVRWELVRRAVRARGVVVFWMGEAARSACAVDGAGRRADAAVFADEFGA